MYIKYNLCDYGECIQKINCLVVSTVIIGDINYYCLRDITQKSYLNTIDCMFETNILDLSDFYNLSDSIGIYDTEEEAKIELNNILKAIEEGKRIYIIK